MTDENRQLRDVLKGTEAVVTSCLHSQPMDDVACREHLLSGIGKIVDLVLPYQGVKHAQKMLEGMTNVFGSRETLSQLAVSMTRMHRTLVQSFAGGFVIPFIDEMSRMGRDGCYDGRDEAAVKACEVMRTALEKEYGIGTDEHIGLPCV